MYPLESFDTSSGATNGGWGDQWPNVSHQEASYPAQAPERAFSPLEDTFFSQSQSYYNLPDPPPYPGPSSHLFHSGLSLTSSPGHPDFAFALCAFAMDNPATMARIHEGRADDGDFATIGQAICPRDSRDPSPTAYKAHISLAKRVYRQYVFLAVLPYILGLTHYVIVSRGHLCGGMGDGGYCIPDLMVATSPHMFLTFKLMLVSSFSPLVLLKRDSCMVFWHSLGREEAPPDMPWKGKVVDNLATSSRFWGYEDRPEGLTWTKDCVVPDEGAEPVNGISGEQFRAASQGIQPQANAGSSSSANHTFSQNGPGITYPVLHEVMDQTQRGFTFENAPAPQPPLPSQHLTNSHVLPAGFPADVSHQAPHGSSFQTSAQHNAFLVPGMFSQPSRPSETSLLSMPSLASGVGARLPIPELGDEVERIYELVEDSRSLYEMGLIALTVYRDTVIIAFHQLAQYVGYFSPSLPPA